MKHILVASALAVVVATATGAVAPDASDIVRKSVDAMHRDWVAAADFDHCETDVTKDGTKTYAVTTIFGSPYSRLTAVNGQPLADDERQRELQKEGAARMARQSEAQDVRARRLQENAAQTRRNRLLFEQVPQAFDFTSEKTEPIDGLNAYVVRASPKRDYRPPSGEAEVLRGMEGRLWIEQNSLRWVKVEATVIRSVEIAGLLARVEPGTQLLLEQRPVSSDVWLPTRFSMRTRARILLLLRQRTQVDESYFDYRRVERSGQQAPASLDSSSSCLPISAN
jgi:hypothetical protein